MYPSLFRRRLRIALPSLLIGFTLCLCGGLLRAVGEIQLGSNFSHRIRVEQSNSHHLFTGGLYS